MPKLKDIDYIHPSMVIKAMENSLIGHDKLERLLTAKTVSDFLKLLSDFGYACAEDGENRFSDKQLSAKRHDVFNKVLSILPQKGLLDFILYPYDYHNAKVLLKSKLIKVQGELSDCGTMSIDAISAAFESGRYQNAPKSLADAVKEAESAYLKSLDSQIIDIILDKACVQDMLDSAKSTRNRFLTEYMVRFIDLANLKSLLRTKRQSQGMDFFGKVFAPGGKLGFDFLQKAFALSNEEFLAILKSTEYAEIAKAFENADIPAWKFEKACDDFLMKYVCTAKYTPFGLEVMAAFLLALDTEIKNLRIILAGKRSGIGEESLRERLRVAYV